MTWKTTATALVFAMAGFLLWSGVHAPRRRIIRSFRHLEAGLSRNPQEHPLRALRRLDRLGTLFDDPCEAVTGEPWFSGTYTPREIVRLATEGRMQFESLRVRFFDIRIEFPRAGQAEAHCTVRARGTLRYGERIDEVRKLRVTLRREGRRWLFTRFETVEILRR